MALAPDLEMDQALVFSTSLEHGQPIPKPDPLPLPHQRRTVVCVGGQPSVVMFENHQLTESPQPTAGINHFPGG